MEDRSRTRLRGRRALTTALGGLVLGVAGVGCQSSQDISAEQALRQQTFAEELAASTDAIRAGELEAARMHLETAGANADTETDHEKVLSLDHLIAGAEALMSGDTGEARHAWSRIDDPDLGDQVREQARLVGFAVPDAPVETEAESEE